MYHNLRISFFWKWNGIYKEKKRKLFESLFKGEFSTFQIERFKENTDKRSSWPSDFYSRNFYLYANIILAGLYLTKVEPDY